ncbi:MAG: sugar phosphate isomerase/epimerase family protein [Candidatus Hadarchaeia archaeon]
MKIGAVLNPYGSPLEQVKKCEGMNLDFVEIVADGEKNGTEALIKRRGDIESALDELSLDLYLHLPWNLDIGNPHEKCREGAVETLKNILRVGADLNAEKAIVHPKSQRHNYWERERIKGNVIRSLQELEKAEKTPGTELIAENVKMFGLDEFERIFKRTGIDMCLDTGHAYLEGFEEREITEFVNDHKDRIKHFHLNDNRGERDEHLPLGYGFIDLGLILRGLQNMGWNGSLSIELFTESFEYLRISRSKVGKWLEG